MSHAQLSLLWQVALASLVALAMLWWLAYGARRWSRTRGLRRSLADTRGTTTPEVEAAFMQAREAMQDGATTLRPQALYAQPWMLFLGDRHSRVAELLQTATSARAAPHGTPGSFWRWWLLPGLVAIESDPQLVEPAADESASRHRDLLANWFGALLCLAERRSAQPLDAVALCVDVQSLLAGPEPAGELGTRLRRRADEASRHLRLRLSTQVLVTGLDRLPGYEVVRAALPEQVLTQAIGVRVPPGAVVVIDDVLAQMAQRLHALQMSLLREQADAPGRLAVHEFFTHWLAAQAGLSAFLKRAFQASNTPFRLRGRALYFVAAPGDKQGAPAFVADLFRRFLPVERAYTSR